MNNVDITQLSEYERTSFIEEQGERLVEEAKIEAKAKGTVCPVLDTEAGDTLKEFFNRPADDVTGVSVDIIPVDDSFIPAYKSSGAAAADLVANVPKDAAGKRVLTLTSRTGQLVDCGFSMALPEGWEADISVRSGWAEKGLLVTNAPGLIDSDFRGTIKVLVFNVGKEILVINHGDRIAQIKPQPQYRFNWNVVNELPPTERGDGGFGSTGV